MRLALCFAILSGSLCLAQPPQGGPGAPPPGGRRPGGSTGAVGPSALDVNDHAGFESIFDGTLKGWDGDPRFWRAENNTIVGESSTDNVVKPNTFLIWRGGQPADFELKLDFKMNSTNSGIQIRSVELPEVGKWVMKGYQADIDFENRYTGMFYEERGRGFLALRGQAVIIEDGKKPRVIANLKNGDDLKGAVNVNGWNTVHIIARGNMLIQILNGQLTSMVVDDDTKGRMMSGLIGFQMHMGPPMKAEFRNIFLKKL